MQSRTFTIAAVIVAAIAFVALAAYIINQNRAALDPSEVTARFYSEWVDTTRNAPPTAYERELHHRSTYVTDEFGRIVDRALEEGRDPVLCLGAAPQNFELKTAAINNEGTGAAVRFSADDARGRVVLVTDEKGWWRIDEVDCEVDLSKPAPTTGTSTATSTKPVSASATTTR